VIEPAHAVFLSYASEDAAAAARIAAALRARGVEVWFDQSELRGGDAWDQLIRRQIRDCRLFVPIISANSEARHEGYFRLEWDLADQRSHKIVRHKAFILPVCLDETPRSDAGVPESFQRVQWVQLPGGEASAAFVERVQTLLSDESSNTRRATQDDSSARALTGPARAQRLTLAAVIAVALLCILGFFGLERLRTAGSAAPRESIAVLPLANESGDTKEQYFSDGISEDLITALSQFPGLRVIGRSSSFHFRDSKEDGRSIGAKLQVAHLLEGSVRRSGDMVRVSAELINTEDGSAQWSERYDRPYKDLFALQDEITRAVAGALRARLLPGENAAAQSERPPSGSLEAYNALLLGQFYYPRGTEADMRKAIESFTQATELDAHYALAWTWLSRAYTFLGASFLQDKPQQEAYVQARACADRALGLAPNLSAAHLARGELLLNAELDWRGAEAELRRATELAPNDGYAKFSLGTQLATFGKVTQAIELTRQALVTEPLRGTWYNWLAIYLTGLNRLDDAEQAIRRAIELQADGPGFHGTLAVIEILRGNAAAALAAAQQETPGSWRDLALAQALAVGSDRGAADAALQALIDNDAGISAFQIAEVYALRDDAKQTFAWLDQAWSQRDAGIADLLYDPFILRYRHDARLAAYCRKVGLPAPSGTTSE
jgi:TolB-like protein/Flp pilus assembly protein TadD